MAKQGNPTFLYEFDHVLSFDAWGPRYQANIMVHTQPNIDFILSIALDMFVMVLVSICRAFCRNYAIVELPFEFHSAKPYYSFTKDEEKLSKDMTIYWVLEIIRPMVEASYVLFISIIV